LIHPQVNLSVLGDLVDYSHQVPFFKGIYGKKDKSSEKSSHCYAGSLKQISFTQVQKRALLSQTLNKRIAISLSEAGLSRKKRKGNK